MKRSKHLFFLMNHVFVGFSLSIAYGVVTAAAIWFLEAPPAFQEYQHAFFVSFNCAISGGIIFSTALLIFKTQEYIPDLIERTFPPETLIETEYQSLRSKFFAATRSIAFAATFAVIGFAIFYAARFPLHGLGEYAMIAFGCIQYALGVYVGRKLFYIAQMLQSIEGIDVAEDIFTEDKIGGIATYVNAISTLTVILVFVHVSSYFRAPFVYDPMIGETIKIGILLPALIAIPVVLLFNFYPRVVLKALYSKSIDQQVARLRILISDAGISKYEKMAYIIEYDKISRDELKYRLSLALSDLPIALTIIIMILSAIFG